MKIHKCAPSLALFILVSACNPVTAPPPSDPLLSAVYCGDGKSRGSESCDGDDLENKTCEDLGLSPGQLACKPDCRAYDVTDCGAPQTCGNGLVDGVERCEGSDLNGQTCESQGYGPGVLTCLSNCADSNISACSAPPGCGDGQKNGSELCDGLDFGSTTCARLGLGVGELSCGAKCNAIDSSDCHPVLRDAGVDASRDAGRDAGRDSGPVDHRDAGGTDTYDGALSCPAAADCSNRECGPDPVCGASCGTCLGATCQNGTCVADPVYGCDHRETITCGSHIVHAASVYDNFYSGYSSCNFDNNFTGGEVVFSFAASTSGRVTVDLTGFTGDLDLIAVDPGCGTQTCRATSASSTPSESLSLDLVVGQVFDLIVDGYTNPVGSFTLDVRCGVVTTDAGILDASGHDATTGIDAATVDAGAPLGTIKWTFSAPQTTGASPAIGADGTIYICADRLYAINPDGTLKWKSTYTVSRGTAVTLGADGTIYFGSGSDLYAVSSSGSVQWTYTTGNIIYSSPSLATDGTIYIGSSDYKLHAVNPDGTSKWSYLTQSNVKSSAAIATDGTIYFGSSYWVYALDPAGNEKWTYATGDWVNSPPAIDNTGNIIVGSGDGKLYNLAPGGTKNWSYSTGAWIDVAPVIASDGIIYVQANNGHVYAINGSGSLVWSHSYGMTYSIAGASLAANNTIYQGGSNGFYALDSTGAVIWSVDQGPGNAFYNSAIASDGTVYVISLDDKLFAIQGDSPLANSPWPKFGANNQNTGR